MATGTLSAAAVVIGSTFPQHDRDAAHYGYEWDEDVVLSASIGPYPVGTRLDVFLAALYGLIQACGTTNPTVASFTAAAIIGTSGVIRANAVKRKTLSASSTTNAVIVLGGVGTVAAAAWLVPTTKAVTADALLVANVC